MLRRVMLVGVLAWLLAPVVAAGPSCECPMMQIKLHGVIEAAGNSRGLPDARVEITVNAAEQSQIAVTDARGSYDVVLNFDTQEAGKPCPTCTQQPKTVAIVASRRGYMTARVEFPFGILRRQEGEAIGRLLVPPIGLLK